MLKIKPSKLQQKITKLNKNLTSRLNERKKKNLGRPIKDSKKRQSTAAKTSRG